MYRELAWAPNGRRPRTTVLGARVLAEHISGKRHLSFVAIGESQSGRTTEEADEMLAEGFGT